MSLPRLVALGIGFVCAAYPGLSHVHAEPVALAVVPSIELVPVLTGLNRPVFVTSARDGSNRLFVVEQGGTIKLLQPGNTTPTTFLDISAKVIFGVGGELLGLTFHPQFSVNRRFFVNYTRRPDGATVIAEYQASQANPNVADDAEAVLLVIQKPLGNHNGGMVEFGPDGFLYIAVGDGDDSGSDPGNRAQDITQLLGKILRIDVDSASPYSSPPNNPFSGTTPGRDEIYAYGLRNPWRFSFDRATGDLYAGDVGQDAVEEIDIITLGGNYGWRIWEGTQCTNNDPALCQPGGFSFPITEYLHTLGRCAVTGGYVYRGTQSTLPVGGYVYGDYCTGEIFFFQAGTQRVVLDSAVKISSFGEDESGEIYVVGLGGTVHRIASPISPPPVVAPVGVGDPLALAAAGVLLPYITGGGTVALVEIASPVQGNPNLQLTFFNAAGVRGGSVSLPETSNDIGFVDVGSVVPAGQNGVVAIAGVAGDGSTPVPLTNPIQARVYLFNASTGRSRVLEPIILDTAESPAGPNTWSPLRTGATFYAPLQTATVNTDLTLICPIATIQDATGTVLQQAFPVAEGFPSIEPAFPAASTAGNLRVTVYDAAGQFLRDGVISCASLTELSVSDIDPIYSDPSIAFNGTYTEIRVDPAKQNAFTGYRAVFTVGSSLNNFFGRLSGGSRLSIEGALTTGAR